MKERGAYSGKGRTTRGIPRLLLAAAVLLSGACSGGDATAPPPQPQLPLPAPPANWDEGVALALVYDTSGSMSETVPDGRGGQARKWEVGNRALLAVVDRIEAWRSAAPKDAPRRVEATLVTFGQGGVPLGPFDPEGLRRFAAGFRTPGGATPLGNAIRAAGEELVRSNLLSKHVLVITDGQNSEGILPEEAMDYVGSRAKSRSTDVSVHFVAFDVDAAVFAAVKSKGATVVGASDATQLDERLKFILEEEILLESPSPAKTGAK